MKDLFIAAIQKRQVVVLRCWQTDGGSESGERHGWKLLNVSEMHSVTLTETVFLGARPRYKRGDTAMLRIYAQL